MVDTVISLKKEHLLSHISGAMLTPGACLMQLKSRCHVWRDFQSRTLTWSLQNSTVSERFITVSQHLTAQRATMQIPCWGIPEAFMSSVSENTQISLIENSESPHECASERCLCLLWWTGDLSGVYCCFWGCTGSLSGGWFKRYLNNTFLRKLATQIQILTSNPSSLSLWHHTGSSYPRICLILFIATLQFKDSAGFLSRLSQLWESQWKHS